MGEDIKGVIKEDIKGGIKEDIKGGIKEDTMSSSDLRDRMDGLQWDSPVTKLETIMPGSSFLTYSRGENGLNGSLERLECPMKYKRTVKKQVDRRGRGRTQPVTFAEIKEVDEDKVEDPRHVLGASGNSIDVSDTEKSGSDFDLKSSFNELSKSLSQRRRKPKTMKSKLRMPQEKLEIKGHGGLLGTSLGHASQGLSPGVGDDDESRDTVSDNLEMDFSSSVKKLPVIYPKGFNFKSRPST